MTHHTRGSRIIVFASPKGGVGRSTCAVALARALAARDRRVLLVDACGLAGSLTILAGLNQVQIQSPMELQPVNTSASNIDLAVIEPIQDNITALFRHWRQNYGYDDIIVDTPAGFEKTPIALFNHADLPILIITPETPVLQLATRWLRQAAASHLEWILDDRELCEHLNTCSESWTFKSVYSGLDSTQQSLFSEGIESFKCAMLLNHRMENSEDYQGQALCHAYGLLLGINVLWIGSVLSDDRRWFFARRLAAVSLFNREDPLVREFDGLAREKLNTIVFSAKPCLPLTQPELQSLDFLRADSPESARQIYRLLWEGYRRENGMVSCILSSGEIPGVISLLEIAYRNSESPQNPSPSMTVPAVSRTSEGTCQDEAGDWLRKHREEANLTIQQLAMKTRIPRKILDNLENLETQGMSPLRLQAYLIEVAKSLEIPEDEILTQFGF